MARPIKSSLDYFPLDTNLDSRVALLEAQYGNDGFAVLIKLWQEIYKANGKLDLKLPGMPAALAKRANMRAAKWHAIVTVILDLGLLDRVEFELNSILTSTGVAKRILKIETDRKNARARWNRGKQPNTSAKNPKQNDSIAPQNAESSIGGAPSDAALAYSLAAAAAAVPCPPGLRGGTPNA